MEIRLSGRNASCTEYHIGWIPKYHRRILNPGVRGYLRKLFPKMLRSMLGCEVVEKMKETTASLLRKKFSWLAKVCWKENVVWSPGYFVSTVRIGEREILKYVKWQQSQDSGQAKLELF